MRIAKHILYYLSIPAAVVLWLGGYVLLDALIFPLENLEYLVAAILFIYGYFYAVLPCVIFILMRFSMLRWYLDPFAATEIPLTLLLMLLAGYLRKFGFQGEALRRLGSFLGRNWGWLPAVFLYALCCSFSLRRAKRRTQQAQKKHRKQAIKLGKQAGTAQSRPSSFHIAARGKRQKDFLRDGYTPSLSVCKIFLKQRADTVPFLHPPQRGCRYESSGLAKKRSEISAASALQSARKSNTPECVRSASNSKRCSGR